MTSLANLDQVELLKERIPDFDNPLKKDYLVCLAVGMTVLEACKKIGIRQDRPRIWRAADAHFAYYEQVELPKNRVKIRRDIAVDLFTKIMYLNMTQDLGLFMRSLEDLKDLSDNEFDLLKIAKRNYTGDGLAKMLQATDVDDNDPLHGLTLPNIHVHIDGVEVVTDEAQRAAARSLLSNFTEHGRIIDGESRLLDDSDSS